MAVEKIYLDTNLLIGFFKNIIQKEKKPSEYPLIIDFLAKHNEIEKFISIFSIAEIIEVLRRTYSANNLSKEYILGLVDTLSASIDLKVIKEASLSDRIIDYTYLCNDAKDAIHIDICRASEMWFITADDKCGRVKGAYDRIMGERKFRKHFTN